MWKIEYHKEAEQDIKNLDHSQQIHVLKAVRRVAKNPLPQSEGGYGKPLGNKNNLNLSGYFKIKLLSSGLRVVYKIVRQREVMKVIVVSVRDDEIVYKLALERIKEL